MAKRKFKFGGSVKNDIGRQKARKSSKYGYLTLDNLTVFKESDGKIQLDIVPYIVTDAHHLDGNADDPNSALPDNPWYKKPIYVHRNIGADSKSVICPKTIGEKCPICEENRSQLDQGVDYDEVKALKPSLRNLYQVIPRDHKEFDEEIHIWDISQAMFQDILNDEIEDGNISDEFPAPGKDGETLSIRFTEKKFGKNSYYEATRVDPDRKLTKTRPVDEEMIEEAPNLDEMIQVLSYKELQKLFLAIDDDDIEEEEEPEEEEDEKPTRRSRTERKSKRSKREEEPEEEEEEELEEPEEEEDEKPTRRSSKRSKRQEPEEEEEEDEKPTRKRGKNKPAKKTEECPEGYEFGTDWDEYDECADCPLFDDCYDANNV